MPVEVRIKVPAELGQLIDRLKGVDSSLARGKALQAFAPTLTRGLVERSGPTGGFARGGSGGVSVLPKGAGLNIQNRFGKALFVEFPTKPHPIRPRRAKMLAWRKGGKAAFSAFKVNKATKAGAFIFAKEVKHPGFKGRFVFKRTVTELVPQLFDRLTAELKSLLGA